MKAAVYRGLNDLRIEECEMPRIGDTDVLLKVLACAICGTDVRIYRHGHKDIHPPQIIGHELVGVVERAGKLVSGYSRWDRVIVDPIITCGRCYYCRKGLTNLCLEFKKNTEAFGWVYPGGFAEYMRVPAKAVERGNLIKVDDGISDEEAAIAEPMGCALNGQMMSKVGPGDQVLIIGAGPIGCMHVELARSLGASKVMISEMNEERLELSRQFGADRYLNPAKEDLKKVLLEETDGIGPSVIIIAAPSKAAQESSLEFAASHAHINFFGGLPKDDHVVSLDSNLIHYKEVYIHGTSGTTTEYIRRSMQLMASRKIDGTRLVSRVIGLEDLPACISEIGKGNHLKVVVKPVHR